MVVLHAKDFDFSKSERTPATDVAPLSSDGRAFKSEAKPKINFDRTAHTVKSYWRLGLDTHEIARRVGIKRCEVHQILELVFDED